MLNSGDIIRRVHKDSLYRNSLYIMASTAIMAILGFVFWIINARLFSTQEIGLATTLISASTLLANISLLGVNNTIIRFLSGSGKKVELINTALVTVVFSSIISATIFLIFLSNLSPILVNVLSSNTIKLFFVITIVFMTINILLESIFIAFRSSGFVFVKNLVLSLIKLIIPILFLSLGAIGIYYSFTISTIGAAMLSFLIMYKKFKHVFRLNFSKKLLLDHGRYSLGSYFASTLGSTPNLILPMLLTNTLGPVASAFFYIDTMINNLLNIISLATTQSIFAEGSHDEKTLKHQIIKGSKVIFLLMVPAVLIIIFFGQYILIVFGKEYSADGLRFLQIISLSNFFYAINVMGTAILNVKKNVKMLNIINIVYVVSLLVLSLLLLPNGLIGIGIALIVSQAFISVFNLHIIIKALR